MLVEAGSQEHFPQAQHYQPPQHYQPQSQNLQQGENLRIAERPNNMDIMTYSQYVNGSIFSIPKSWSQKNTDDMLVTVYSFIKTYIGASGAGQGSIDNRIEQAMDLVKSHLMSAVRSEVEELRDKISKLEDTVTILSRENEVLRANVNPDVLASLTGNRNLVGGMNSISNLPCQPPDPTGHPALQPPNQHWAPRSAVYINMLYIEASNSR